MLLAGTYWFTHVEAACSLPLQYRIGTVDPRFELSTEDVRIALMEAEAVWENGTGKNVFAYDENARVVVNFIYDDRQALADAEETLRERLDSSEEESKEIDETYAELVARYTDLNMSYKDRVAAYERRMNAYNAEVARYNKEGGAPPDAYARLEDEKRALDTEMDAINTLATELNGLVAQINSVGEEGNEVVDTHNQWVDQYNKTFAEAREFTQGDYQERTINIYTFTDHHELDLVLAHELGHAIGLDHVANAASIMYYLMGGQPQTLTPSAEDLAQFDEVCGSGGGTMGKLERMQDRVSTWLHGWRAV
jgi:hypothetical protein